MSARDLSAALLAALDDQAVADLAQRLRPHLDGHDPDTLLTPAQAAEHLHLHPKTVVRMARDGRLPAVKVGAGWRFYPDHLHFEPRPMPSRLHPTLRRARGRDEPASVAAIRGE